MSIERKQISKLYHDTVGRGISIARERKAAHTLKEFDPGNYFVSKVPPYVSQLADAEQESIAGFYGGISDKRAMVRFGAESLEDFSYWAWRSCSIAALQMVISANRPDFNKNTMTLVKEGLALGGYDIENDIGWYHRSLVNLAEQYGMKATMKKFIPPSEIALEISRDKYVLTAVKSDTGGHIFLSYGFVINDRNRLEGFWVHDPVNYEKDGEAQFITTDAFQDLTTRRAVVIEA